MKPSSLLIIAAVLGLAGPASASDPCAAPDLYEPGLKATRWPEAVASRVAVRGGRPTILLGERAEPPWVLALPAQAGSRWSWEERSAAALCQAARAGLTLFVVDLPLDALWPAADSFSIALARRQVEGVWPASRPGRVILQSACRSPLAGGAPSTPTSWPCRWCPSGGPPKPGLVRSGAGRAESVSGSCCGSSGSAVKAAR